MRPSRGDKHVAVSYGDNRGKSYGNAQEFFKVALSKQQQKRGGDKAYYRYTETSFFRYRICNIRESRRKESNMKKKRILSAGIAIGAIVLVSVMCVRYTDRTLKILLKN